MPKAQSTILQQRLVDIDSPKDLGAAIKFARKQAGLRIVDAAMLSGVATQTFVDIEAGRLGVSIGKLMQVTDYLGVALFAVPARERNLVKNVIEQYIEST